ncbi:MAG: cytidine deaminase [Oscillospiraceae bacterium]|nr:cytidine deaminase [Clostridiaceae bacterium]MDY5949122.1 cytidine deaminase [Oscillospiraceae bacterium]
MNDRELIEAAARARKMSYSPYSGFAVGAALLCEDGSVFTGCNIENSAFSPTNCAERTAFFKAVSEGRRGFAKIAVVGGRADLATPEYCCPPCGVCRQVMKEFCKPDFEIIMAKSGDEYKIMTLSELLPASFDKREV